MKKYIGFKMVEAIPMDLGNYNIYRGWTIPENEDPKREGYLIKYPDNYESWSPKEIFEQAYMQVGDNNTIEERNVNDFIKNYDIKQWGNKTTVVHATLANGFIITESSSCVDPANFNIDVGASICKERIQNQVWQMLGFLLQTAKTGVIKSKE